MKSLLFFVTAARCRMQLKVFVMLLIDLLICFGDSLSIGVRSDDKNIVHRIVALLWRRLNKNSQQAPEKMPARGAGGQERHVVQWLTEAMAEKNAEPNSEVPFLHRAGALLLLNVDSVAGAEAFIRFLAGILNLPVHEEPTRCVAVSALVCLEHVLS